MHSLDQPITSLKGISDKRAALYKKLSITTVGELLTYYPRDYIDYSQPLSIAETIPDEMCVVAATVEKKLKPYFGTKVTLWKVVLADDTGELLCNIWGNEYSYKALTVGKEYLFYGRISGTPLLKEITSPLFIAADSTDKIVPKYALTKGLSNVMLGNNIRASLPLYDIPEPLPEPIIDEYGLMKQQQAITAIHFPKSISEMQAARRRLIFEELLILQLGLAKMKTRNKTLTASIMSPQELSDFYSALPFEPTKAQTNAVHDCICDMQKDVPMNRLLQGDVGSGKTMVAAALCYFAKKNGYQSTMMAPTEILATQHYDTLSAMLSTLDVKIVLLTGGMTAAEKQTAYQQINSGEADVIVGTHAVIQQNVEFCHLGLAVVDEQHRFGVKQRGLLSQKGNNPHILVMSATPIPRTLGLIVYGDLDISVLDELPKGRIAIRTYAVDSSYRERLYKFILKHVAEGRQAYIVCPLVEDGISEKTSATRRYEELKNGWFRSINIGLLHGRMKESEKSAIMSQFKANKLSVLISTTVIEVGVDVPNAVIMLIENAEQFGLSQLHQLRGRVGRGDIESHCILMSDSKSDYTRARLDTMVRTTNGFEIANEDLALRGPGDFFGSRQHGLPQLKIADMSKNVDVINETRTLVARILEHDPDLSLPQHENLLRKTRELFSKDGKIGFN